MAKKPYLCFRFPNHLQFYKMRLYPILLSIALLLSVAPVLSAQGKATDLSPTGVLEWQALKEISKNNFLEAANLYEKAAALAKSQNNPLQFYYRHCQASNLIGLKNKAEVQAIYAQNNTELALAGLDQSGWACFSLMAKYNLQNDFVRSDSLNYYVGKMQTAAEDWDLSPEYNFVRALLCKSIFYHYSKLQQAETAYKYMLQAYNLINSPEWKFSYVGVEISQLYIMSAMYADKTSSELKKLNNDLINVCAQNSPQMDVVAARFVKANYIQAYIKRDTSEIRRQQQIYTQMVQKVLQPQSLEMANYYNDLAMVENTIFKNPLKAWEFATKGMAILENLNSPLARTNLGISSRTIGDAFNNPKNPMYNVAQAKFYYKKSANALLNPNYQLKGENDFPDFSKAEVYCHNEIIMLYSMQGFFNADFPDYEKNPTLSAKNKLLGLSLNALSLLERHREKAANEADLKHWEELYFKTNKNLGEIHYVWYQKNKSQADLDQLLHYSEQYKGTKMRRHLNEERAFVLAKINPADVNGYKRLKSEREDALLQYHQETENGNKEKSSYFLEVYYTKSKRMGELQNKFKQDYPLYAKLLAQAKNKTLVELQQTLTPDMLMLNYFHYKKADGILMLSKDSVWVQLRNTSNDTNLISWSAVANMLKNPSSETDIQNTERAILARNLWGIGQTLLPNEATWQAKGIKRLLIVPHSFLSILPFELLLTSELENNTPYKEFPFLLKKYAIQYAPSATLWAETKQMSAQNVNNGKILAFAPTYQNAAATDKRAVLSGGLRENLSELKGAVKELQNLEKYYYGDYLYGEAANEAGFKDKINQNYAIYHLAMHGLLNEDKPALSALVFSEQKGSAEDDFLTSLEIAQLSFRSQLTVLSACETAAGQMQINEGALSLARYFMHGASPAVVATRWQVNDATTAFIMQNFYKGLYEGKAISEAMRAAQLSYLAQAKGDAAHPFYWAAFMNIGDADKSVYLADKNWAMRYLIIFGSVGLSIIGFGWWKYRRINRKAA